MKTIDVKDIDRFLKDIDRLIEDLQRELIEDMKREAVELVPYSNQLSRQRAELMERAMTLYNIVRKIQSMVKTK